MSSTRQIKRFELTKVFVGLIVVFVLALSIQFFVSTASAQLADSPWPMFRHDQEHTGKVSYSGPQNPQLRWAVNIGSEVDSSPVIAEDGTIYVVPDNGYLYAFNPDGSEKWRYNVRVKRGVNVHDTTPAIGSDGCIYVLGMGDCGWGEGTVLYAINPDGTKRWDFKCIGYRDVSSSVTVVQLDGNEVIYVPTADVWYGYLYSLNADGTRNWLKETHYDCFAAWSISTPAVRELDDTIYVGAPPDRSDRKPHLWALMPDGSVKWKFETIGSVDCSPAIGEDGNIYFGTTHGQFYAVSQDGTQKWKKTIGDFFASPAIDSRGIIYCGSENGNLYAFGPNEGTIKWSYLTGGAIKSSPVCDKNGNIYVGSNDGNLYAINSDGTLKWKYKTAGEIFSSPAISKDGTIYVGSKDGYLYAIGEAKPPLNVEITYPIEEVYTGDCNEAKVGGTISRALKEGEEYMWIALGLDGQWYPQENGPIEPSGLNWETIVYIAGPSVETKIEVAVLIVDDTLNSKLKNYIQEQGKRYEPYENNSEIEEGIKASLTVVFKGHTLPNKILANFEDNYVDFWFCTKKYDSK